MPWIHRRPSAHGSRTYRRRYIMPPSQLLPLSKLSLHWLWISVWHLTPFLTSASPGLRLRYPIIYCLIINFPSFQVSLVRYPFPYLPPFSFRRGLLRFTIIVQGCFVNATHWYNYNIIGCLSSLPKWVQATHSSHKAVTHFTDFLSDIQLYLIYNAKISLRKFTGLVVVGNYFVTIRPVKNVQKPGMVTVVRADLWEKEETWSSGVIYLSSACVTAQLALHHGPWNSLTQVQTSIFWYFLTPKVICASISISVYKYTCFLSPEYKVCPHIGVSSLYYHQSTVTGDLTVS